MVTYKEFGSKFENGCRATVTVTEADNILDFETTVQVSWSCGSRSMEEALLFQGRLNDAIAFAQSEIARLKI